MKNEDKDLLRNEISGLINSEQGTEFPSIDIQPVEPLDLVELDERTKKKAENIVISCMKLYFEQDIITKSEFMAAKSAITTSNIKTLMKQIEIGEHMINKIVNSIDTNNLNTRLFEVAGQLQNNIIDMLKNVQLHVISMQEEFKRLQTEFPQMNKIIVLENTEKDSENTKIYTNSKSMLLDLENENTDSDNV